MYLQVERLHKNIVHRIPVCIQSNDKLKIYAILITPLQNEICIG